MKYTYHLVFITLFALSACKSAKKVTTTTTEVKSKTMPPLSISSILSRLAEKEIKAEWLSGDVSTDYKGKPMSMSASMAMRFRRDSVIWMNVKKLGFNIVRAKVTPDSIFIVNYIQSNYIAQDLKYLEKKYSIPADFKMLQNLMLGNPIFLTDPKALVLERDATGDVLMKGKNAQWQALYHLNAQGEMLKEMVFEQPISSRTMKITYQNYDILRGYAKGDSKFAYLRTINVESPETGKISVTLEVDTDGLEVNVPKNIKFDIPTHYTRMD